jgi:hypothetical protein
MMLVEKDGRGISRRIQTCDVDVKGWFEAEPVTETVYLF